MKVWKRYGWRDFYYEYAMLCIAVLYYILHRLGQKRNQFLAQKWIDSNKALLTEQFAQFGIPSNDGRIVPLSHDGGALYESYATGRVAIRRLWIEINMISRHDPFALVVESVGSFFFEWFGPGQDLVEVTIEPSAEWEGFTWGVVKKGKMRRLKQTSYSLVCTTSIWRGKLTL